jgi:formamidopyrimidine-DNA glycosylase
VLWAGNDPQSHKLLSALGPEPLDDAFSGYYLQQNMRTRTAAIKITIMDSHLVVGVGNIYASESLFRARIHPLTPAKALSLDDCNRLVVAIKSTLRDALAAGGSSLRDFLSTDGSPGYFQQAYFAYARTGQPCKICANPIKNIRLGQRSTFYCDVCQRLP